MTDRDELLRMVQSKYPVGLEIVEARGDNLAVGEFKPFFDGRTLYLDVKLTAQLPGLERPVVWVSTKDPSCISLTASTTHGNLVVTRVYM